MSDAWKSFFSELVAVILGIVITFAGQGAIDRAHSRKEVRSALQLVRTELISNRQDIVDLREILEQVQESAQYLADNPAQLKNIDRLDSTTLSTVTYHQGMVLAEVSVTLPHDALELLKTSSIFQKIGDNSLSMKIIRAYDSCSQMAISVDRHIAERNAQPADSLYNWIELHDPRVFADPADIDKAITAINVYLRR